MFLKRIEMQGFKSFADKVVVNFDHPITGIVGPNGCGKSNISDAIRWVLGEQSVKSMRGSTMTDVIFNGSEVRRKVNLAQVTLVFDNSNGALNSQFQEVEITRRLYRDTKESEYLINKATCRLRDIHDLVMDTGLGKDSLSIISQGTVSLFAEAKPSERRLVFEEAAGVSKYKKRKIESINKLERTKENIDRMQDIVEEISKQVNSLKRAAKKASIYLEKKKRLEDIEVSFLCRDILEIEKKLDQESQEYQKLVSQIQILDEKNDNYDYELQEKRKYIFEMEQSIQKLQDTVMQVINEISQLEARKIEIEQRRKYQIEVGNTKEKIQALKNQLVESEKEYQERKQRHVELKNEVEFVSKENQEYVYKLNVLKDEINQVDNKDQILRQKLGVLEHRLMRPFEGSGGVGVVLSNKNSLYGVHDIVENIIIPNEGYELAINTALAAANKHIVVDSDDAAVNAINFLKKNMSGRATFIPLSVCIDRYISDDVMAIAKSVKGFEGVASELISIEQHYDLLAMNLLGNVLVVDSIDNAKVLNRRLNKQYKIVTLDGDVIHRGGTMTGGKSRSQQQNIHLLRRQKEELEEELVTLEEKMIDLKQQQTALDSSVRNSNDKLMQLRISLAQLEPMLEVKRAKYERLKEEYEELDPKETDGVVNQEEDDNSGLITRLNQRLMQKDELSSQLSLTREKVFKLNGETRQLELEIRDNRQQHKQLSQRVHQFEINKTKYDTQIENNLNRLSSEYQMTYEYALENIYDENLEANRDEILHLRSEITQLGNINLEAPQEYEETKARFDFYNEQLSDLIESRNKLLNVIDEMDTIMVTQFKDMFDKINNELDEVFKALFGGGKAKLVLEDPDDLLNTGIDIDVSPPGKSVQNIRLFSGGEKSLIAISVLFAILKARVVPLCIFDEVEAALDQANVERLANYIKNYHKDTQFIIITHRPGTMAKADVLYGVTMPTKGVSSMLKVKLEEATLLKEGN